MKVKILIACLFLILVACKERKHETQEISKAQKIKNVDSTNESTRIENVNSAKDNEITKSDEIYNDSQTIPSSKKDALDGILYRTIEGEEVKIKLQKPTNKRIEYPYTLWTGASTEQGNELRVKEIYPHVIEFQSMFSEKRWDDHEKEYYNFEVAIPKEIQFFDKDYKYIRSFAIRENNPFLKDTVPNAKITEYFYNIAEYYTYLPKSEQRGTEKISDQWVYANIDQNENLPIVVTYHALYSTKQHFITGGNYQYVLLDSIGNIINKLNTSYQQLSGAAFSPDGKYALIGFTQGETTMNAGIKSEPEGFELWDLDKNQLLHREINDDPNMWISQPSYFNNSHFRIRYTYPNSKQIGNMTYLFDLNNKTIFYRVFSTEEQTDISINWFKKYKNYAKVKKIYHFDSKKFNYGK